MYWASEEADCEGLDWKDASGVAVQMCGYVVGGYDVTVICHLVMVDARLVKSC